VITVKAACDHNASLRHAFSQYMKALIAQMLQLAVCNRHHDVDQQFCRLLLSRLDRNGGVPIEMSHEDLARALGTTSERVTRVALDLWSAGAIEQAAGNIKVLDRATLESRTCDCYGDVRMHYDQMLPGWNGSGRYPAPAAACGREAVASE
jgi:CRP-like cAMP-binding protein